MQDDLVRMFNQNMAFSNTEPQERMSRGQPATSSNYMISQHYHHSAHVMRSPPSDPDHDSTLSGMSDAEQMLAQHNVDPSTLSPSQIRLFENAGPEQRSRLIELWLIAPPERYRHDGLGGWQETTLEREEEMARVRCGRGAAEEEGLKRHGRMVHLARPLGNDDGSIGTMNTQDDQEPYMKSGYEMLAERDYNRQLEAEVRHRDTYSPLGSAVGCGYQRAFDPTYAGREWWRDFHGQQPIEHQYGMFQEANRFSGINRATTDTSAREDEEML
jgi:hypothetical protein